MDLGYTQRATNYALNVTLGAIPACVEVRQACQRFLNIPEGYHLDIERAEVPCRFIEQLCHVKGRWASNNEKLILSDWQIFIVVNIFGMVNTATGRRKYRVVYIKVPRKNGKSTLMAAIGLYMLCADGETGGEVYCGATSQKQAWEVFKPALMMVKKDQELRDHFGVEALASNLNVIATNSKFEPVTGKPGDGPSPSCAIVDEYHEHLDSDQFDAFDTGQGAREEPLLIVITTAGDNIGGPCYDLEDSARKIVSGVMSDETFFALIYGIDPKDKWDSVESQIKANPNYGISCDVEYLAGKLNTAKQRSSQRGIYKTKHLNQWVGARDAYFDSEMWNAAGDVTLDMNDFIGRRCVLSLDLASKVDPAALIITFPPTDDDPVWTHFCKFYIPEAKADDEANKDFRGWVDEGFMTSTPGNVIDFDFIKEDVETICKVHDVTDIPYDPFQATQFSVEMVAKGIPMVEYGATVRNFSEPMKEVDANIRKRAVRHDGNKVMNWMIGNVVARLDAKDNVFPRKNKPNQLIDGPVALIMAVGRCIAGDEEDAPSVYETRGVITF